MSQIDELKDALTVIMTFASALEDIAKTKAVVADKAKDSADFLKYFATLIGAEFDKGYAKGLIDCAKQVLEIIYGQEDENHVENVLN